MKKIINLIILGAMIASIAVQYNDPDGLVWAIIYGYAAIMAINALRNQYNAPLLIIGLIGYIVGAKILLPPSLDGWITNEVARESGGLFISAICLIILIIQMILTKNKPDSPQKSTDSAE